MQLKSHVHAFTLTQEHVQVQFTYTLHTLPRSNKYLYIIFGMFLEGRNAVLALIKCTDPSLMSAGFYVCREGRGCDRALISAIIPDATHTHTHTSFRFRSVW